MEVVGLVSRFGSWDQTQESVRSRRGMLTTSSQAMQMLIWGTVDEQGQHICKHFSKSGQNLTEKI